MTNSLISKIIGKKHNHDEEELTIKPTASVDETGIPTDDEEGWLDDDEGQLSVDVFQTDDQIIIKSTIAGVKPEDIDISINNDMRKSTKCDWRICQPLQRLRFFPRLI